MLDLTSGFNGLGRDNCKMRWKIWCDLFKDLTVTCMLWWQFRGWPSMNAWLCHIWIFMVTLPHPIKIDYMEVGGPCIMSSTSCTCGCYWKIIWHIDEQWWWCNSSWIQLTRWPLEQGCCDPVHINCKSIFHNKNRFFFQNRDIFFCIVIIRSQYWVW